MTVDIYVSCVRTIVALVSICRMLDYERCAFIFRISGYWLLAFMFRMLSYMLWVFIFHMFGYG